MKTKILAVPDGEFLSLEDLTRTCRTKRAFPPSVMSIEPLTEVRWSQAIHIKEVHWRNKSIPQIAPTDKGKKVRDSLFSKVSRLIRDAWINDKALKKSIEDNIATVLMDRDRVSSRSLQTEIDGSCEFRELFFRKMLNARRKNFVPGDAFAQVDMLIMEVLTESHRIAMVAYLGFRKLHNLFSELISKDTVLFNFVDFFEEFTHAVVVHSLSACEPVELVCEESLPDRSFSEPHSITTFAQTAARLRDLMSSIHSVKLQSQELLSSFKSDCNERMTSLELSVEDLRQSHMALVNKQWRKHLYLLRRGDKLKDGLSLEITATRSLECCYKISQQRSIRALPPSALSLQKLSHILRVLVMSKSGKVVTSAAKKNESSSGGKHRWF
ncbi:hypothetical protein F511_07859 [Dorcoceras hygrometricum]|uniref:Uncharacterized protein n=1 Tax=Dorcoceras hygrometricum TaxID=472368 RepID=A0A2Z7DI99_9LAMI|nr:hypothetical protein F511_07859 [Dorcoceras hygrometricum]